MKWAEDKRFREFLEKLKRSRPEAFPQKKPKKAKLGNVSQINHRRGKADDV